MLRLFFTILFCSALSAFAFTQSNDTIDEGSPVFENNPFLLDNQVAKERNPFAIYSPNTTQGVRTVETAVIKPSPNHTFKFIYFTGLIIFLTALISLFRTAIETNYRAFWNENILKLLQRQSVTLKGSSILTYLFYFLNMGVLLAQLACYWTGNVEQLPIMTLWCTCAVFGWIMAKHLLLWLLGAIFPLSTEVTLYNFSMLIFGGNLGIFLLPFNLLAAFGPEGMKPGIFYIACALYVLALFFRNARLILQTSGLWSRNLFHFFIYLCSFEIAPLLVLSKLIFAW